MKMRLAFMVLTSAVLLAGGRPWEPPVVAESLTSTLLGGSNEICLMPPEGVPPEGVPPEGVPPEGVPPEGAADQQTVRGGGAGSTTPVESPPRAAATWPPPNVLGGDVQPVRTVFDPYPTFDGVAVDAEIGRAFFSDSSLSGMLSYKIASGSDATTITEPETHIVGPKTGLGFATGLAIDPGNKEVFVVNNDGGGMVVFSYDDSGATRPVRQLETPHQSWGLAVSVPRDEVAVSVQQMHGIVIYKRDAKGLEPPLRTIRGYATGLADPHGVDIDADRKEIVVANHGNWTELRPYSPYDPLSKDPPSYQSGRFEAPSIRIYDAAATGNAKPLRAISGAKPGLNWPMGLEVDAERDEIVVANYGDDSVRFFRRATGGNVEPVRVIKGDRTSIRGPVDVSVDRKTNELWVANYADHTAIVFDRDASGNAAPKRIVRNAPKGAPSLAFTNASAAAYDTKRDALIVPN